MIHPGGKRAIRVQVRYAEMKDSKQRHSWLSTGSHRLTGKVKSNVALLRALEGLLYWTSYRRLERFQRTGICSTLILSIAQLSIAEAVEEQSGNQFNK